MKIFCETEADTLDLGRRLAPFLKAGDCVLLDGEMGAGKSVIARGIARGLGITGPVSSPTFTILNIYDGIALRLYHFDFYRLSSVDELYAAGLDEFIPSIDGVCVIEWPGVAAKALPQNAIRIGITADEKGRKITLPDIW